MRLSREEKNILLFMVKHEIEYLEDEIEKSDWIGDKELLRKDKKDLEIIKEKLEK